MCIRNAQRIPEFLRESQNASTKDASQEVISYVFPTWQKSGSCPKGTVPIRRILKEDILRVASLDRFGVKPPTLNGSNTVVVQNRSVHITVNIRYVFFFCFSGYFPRATAEINPFEDLERMCDHFDFV